MNARATLTKIIIVRIVRGHKNSPPAKGEREGGANYFKTCKEENSLFYSAPPLTIEKEYDTVWCLSFYIPWLA